MSHPVNDLDDAAHQRVRLGILAILAEAKEADFTYLRETLELTDGNLATHLRVLEGAGWITVRREGRGRGARSWIAITGQGREALDREVRALRALLDRIPPG
jgi:DNA-binding MarR family transcriptional regulator